MRSRYVVVVLLLLASRVEAEPITYTSRAAFESALGQIQMFDFSNPSVFTDATLGMDLLSYQDLTVYIDRASGQTTIDAVQHGEISNPTHVVQFVFSDPRRAFGLDVETADHFRIGAMGMDGGWESAGLYGISRSGFFGVIFDSHIAGATIFPWDSNGEHATVSLDNLTTNSVPVPEPAYLWLFGATAAFLMARASSRPYIHPEK
jgi:hypothetical protein